MTQKPKAAVLRETGNGGDNAGASGLQIEKVEAYRGIIFWLYVPLILWPLATIDLFCDNHFGSLSFIVATLICQ